MDYGIIVDSCCDLTRELKKRLGIISVPLTMRLGDKEFIDDENLDLSAFMAEMKANPGKAGSAAPAPSLFWEAMERAGRSFVITLSSKLSGSFESAMAGKSCAEEHADIKTHIFDSKSASAGELLAAIKLHELLRQGLNYDDVVKTVSKFIDGMKTYFVLENYDNLVKNGRMRKVTESLIRVLNIKLIMGSDGNGEIALHAKALGSKQSFNKLLSLIQNSGRETQGENLVISHCNNEEAASKLAEAVRDRFDFKEVYVVPSGGLSSLYTDDGGMVMAF